MTTLTLPTLQRSLLLTVGKAVADDGVEENIRLGVGVIRQVRESVGRMRREFEDNLARGVEAGSLACSYGPMLAAATECLLQLERLLEELSTARGSAKSFIDELDLLQREYRAFRDLMAAALSLASRPSTPMDWERLRQESDADFTAGRFTTFETAEDMLKGLASSD
jgi:hypothetical protein